MLQQANRLTKKRDIELLFTQGVAFHGRFLTLVTWKIDPLAFPRRGYSEKDLKVGFVVSKKIDTRAPVRNRLKRQMREAVRLRVKARSLKNGYFLLFLAKKQAVGSEYLALEKDIIALLSRARLSV